CWLQLQQKKRARPVGMTGRGLQLYRLVSGKTNARRSFLVLHDAVDAPAAIVPFGLDGEAALLLERARDCTAYRVRLPAERCDGLRDGGAAFTSEHVDQARELGALTDRVRRRLR